MKRLLSKTIIDGVISNYSIELISEIDPLHVKIKGHLFLDEYHKNNADLFKRIDALNKSNSNGIIVEFEAEHISASFLRFVYRMCYLLNHNYDSVKVIWWYDKFDEIMLENGELLAEAVDVDFKLKENTREGQVEDWVTS